jgi:hypothetical protein
MGCSLICAAKVKVSDFKFQVFVADKSFGAFSDEIADGLVNAS